MPSHLHSPLSPLAGIIGFPFLFSSLSLEASILNPSRYRSDSQHHGHPIVIFSLIPRKTMASTL